MSKALARSMSGTKLIEKRVAAGLTVHQLAAKARVSVQSLQKWERGAAKPQAAKARAVRDVLAQFEKPQDDVIDRDALAADVENLLGVVQNLLLAVAHVEKHLDSEVRDMLNRMEAARNGSK